MEDSAALGMAVVKGKGLVFQLTPGKETALISTRKWGQKLKMPGRGDRKESWAIEGA